LYGRGGADDGYSTFAAVTAIKALQTQGIDYGRCVIIIEACEESGSPDLPAYVSHLESRIGVPSLIICLDSGCGTYDQLWITTSLRGLIAGDLRVDVLKDGSHSGHASGVVPSSFRIIRMLLNRLEDVNTGRIIPPEFYCEIPEQRLEQIKSCAHTLGNSVYEEFAWAEGCGPVSRDNNELILNRTWRPQLSVTGADGLPALKSSGNVLRTHTALKLSLRLPPRINATQATHVLKNLLEKDPPYGSKVSFNAEKAGSGWDSPALAPWLQGSLNNGSNAYFNKPVNFIAEGGSIPFMGMLGAKFPDAQFVITGVLGPESNAHGPNEMLHIDFAKRITCCVVNILADHFVQFRKN